MKKKMLIGLGLVMAILASELVYVWRNESWRVDRWLLNWNSRMMIRDCGLRKDVKAARRFGEILDMRMAQMRDRHGEWWPGGWNSEMDQDFFCEVVGGLGEEVVVGGLTARIAPFVYELGLRAYRQGQEGWVVPLWERAIYLAPDWSYYHVELANYYMDQGNDEAALRVLGYCGRFESAGPACGDYGREEVNEVGFLEAKIGLLK